MLKSIFKVDDPNQIRPVKLAKGEELENAAGSVSWEHCFDASLDVPGEEPGSSFRVYTAGNLTEAPFVWVFLHGAGQSSLTWAHVAAELKAMGGAHAILAYDARGHGGSKHDDELDLSRQRQALDCLHVLRATPGAADKPVCLTGHSMGGAVAVEAAGLEGLSARVNGLLVLDVVEGTAMASISAINKFIATRPSAFESEAQAIRWAVDSQTVRSEDSARISVPAQLSKYEQCYQWRTDLAATKDHWKDWYENMSERFLAVPKPKMLMLAGMDRLDTPLMIGQMQGKYQLAILPQCGHQLHEEAPAQVAEKFCTFANRFLLQ